MSIISAYYSFKDRFRKKIIRAYFEQYEKEFTCLLQQTPSPVLAMKIEKDFQNKPAESLWDEFKKIEQCPNCSVLKEIKCLGGQLTLTKQIDNPIFGSEIVIRKMDINFCVVCGKKIE